MSKNLLMGPNVSWKKYAYPKTQTLILLFLLLTYYHAAAQRPAWVELMYSDTASIEKLSSAYEKYYDDHVFVKNRFTQDYKRYLKGFARKAFPSDDIKSFRVEQENYRKRFSTKRNNPASWTAVGPFDIDLNAAAVGATPGLGHVYTVEKDEFLVAGTATAGLWKSTNNGQSWQSITKDLMVTEIKAVETVGNTILFGGDGHIYRSVDGGKSWQPTGSSSFKSSYHVVLDIVFNGSEYFAATNLGLYRSSDGGGQWARVVNGKFQEIEIHPTDPSIIYAIAQEGQSTAFYRSDNGGISFEKIDNGFPTVGSNQEQRRTEIAVSKAMPGRVVALAAGEANGGSGLFGIYVSDDTGLSWDFRCCGTGPGGPASSENKNILAWQTSGTVSGGQYYYDLALAISQENADIIYAGGINIWKSVDGGQSFTNNADYIYQKAGNKYVHADIQDIKIYDDEIWVASDGGIFMSNDGGNSFEKRMRGIVATDFKGFGAGAKDGEVMIGGTFHNGTLVKLGNTFDGGWLSAGSGDHNHGQVNPQNNRVTYSDMGIVHWSQSASSMPTFGALTTKPNASYSTGVSSEYVFDPNSSSTFYLGSGGSLYRTTDNGVNFVQVKNFGSGKVTKIEIAPSNPDVIYLVYYPSYSDHKKLFRTTDGGSTWADVSPQATVFQNNKLWIAWDIAVDSQDENKLWLARTPQTNTNALINGFQVFQTNNGGASWQNISDSQLDGEMITNIVHQKGTAGGVYIGTRRSVYYKNELMNAWQMFHNGMPAISYSTQLVILYEEDKILNATHRGVYASNLYEKTSKTLSFQVDKNIGICQNDLFTFTNTSQGFSSNASIRWIFENGTPAISEEAEPTVRFDRQGSHSVTLEIIENGQVSRSEKTDFILIERFCEAETIPGNAIKTKNGNFLMIPSLDVETNNITFTTWVKRGAVTKNNAGLITMQRFANNTGLSLSSSGEVKLRWNETGTGTGTGLMVPANEWTHVAMSVSPTGISVYVNGIERRFEGNFVPVTFDKNILLGKDANSISYYLDGEFDELAIYDEALSTQEIREQINLIKEKEKHPNLKHYYQFNWNGDIAADIVGSKHASFFNTGEYRESMAPVGRGVSQVKKIDSFGKHLFSDVDVELDIASGISCNSDLGVYKIERNVAGSSDTHISDFIYLVNHFSEEQFAINGEITIARAFNTLGNAAVVQDSFKLYQLGFDDEPNWDENERAYAMAYDPESEDKVVFEVDEVREMEGKFLVSYNQVNASLAVSDIYFDLKLLVNESVEVNWFLHPEDDFIRTELQRSRDAITFETIETLDNEKGQLDFRYIDENAWSGRNYYRVKMTYSNGEQDYSRVDNIVVPVKAQDQFAYPNPVSGDIIYLKDIETDEARCTLYDFSGKLLFSTTNLNRGSLDVSKLGSGAYLMVLEDGNKRRQQMIIRQ